MLKSFVKTALRSFRRQKGYFLINVTGLAFAIASAFLLFVIVNFEYGYDSFNTHFKHIYRLVTRSTSPGGDSYKSGVPYVLTDYLRLNLPEIQQLTPIDAIYGVQIAIPDASGQTGGAKFREDYGAFFIEPQYFQIFDAKWLAGSPSSLAAPGTVVLDRTTATKYFGQFNNATGRYIKMDNSVTLKVSGVIEDMPANSDFPLRIVVSYATLKENADKYGYDPNLNYFNSSHQAFLLMPDNMKQSQLDELLVRLSNRLYNNHGGSGTFNFLLPLSDNHFDSRFETLVEDHTTSKATLRTLALIGLLIIVMASINFINITTAQADQRAKEIGIRKVLGSARRQLISQLLLETATIVFLATLLGGALASILLPNLKSIAGIHGDISLLSGANFLFLGIAFLSVTLLSGTYPSLILSGLKPIAALRRRTGGKIAGGIELRKVLVVVQFSILQMLMIATIVIVAQMNFIHSSDLGFVSKGVFVAPCYPDSSNYGQLATLKDELLRDNKIAAVSYATDPPSSINNWSSNFYFNYSKQDMGFNVFLKYSDADYFKTFDLKPVAGRLLKTGDTTKEFVVNQQFARKAGVKNVSDIIGKTIRIGKGQWFPIVGVVKDFKTNSLREDVKPTAIAVSRSVYSEINIKFATADSRSTIAYVQHCWQKAFPNYAFTGEFLDDSIGRFYQQENQLALLYKTFAVIALLISCLGLYSLIAFLTLKKTKEVAIRKVLGATTGSILLIFLKELSILILISYAIAIPLGYLGVSKWLNNFSYRIQIGTIQFLEVLILALLIACLTVGNRVIRAALATPNKSLRSE